MRVTIIIEDGLVAVDGIAFTGIDLSALDQSIHAVQWYDTKGEIEIKDASGRIIENLEITSFDEYAFVIPLWEKAQVEWSDKQKALAKEQATLV